MRGAPMGPMNWREEYRAKIQTADQALARLRSGQRVFVGSSCGEPQHLVDALLGGAERLRDLEIVRLLSLEGSITSIYGDREYGHTFTVRSIYQGAGQSEFLSANWRFFAPMDISLIPRLFAARKLRIDAALVQVSPPDEFGWMSLGISVDITRAGARAADYLVLQVNPRMPRVLGQGFIHVSEAHAIVEHEEELLAVLEFPAPDASDAIAELIENRVDDGATIQLGLGHGADAVIAALAAKRDLGVHTQYFTDGIMQLMNAGAVTNRRKTAHEGKSIASTAMGTEDLYRFVHDNPGVEFHASDYINNPAVIASQHRMTAINFGTAIDLTGQIAIDALPQNHFSGVTGVTDFVDGAVHSPGGRSIMVIPALTADGTASRIVPGLAGGSVVIPRSDVYHVVSEYGAVNLYGKNIEERAMALIGIAHPDHREALFDRARADGLIGPRVTLQQSLCGVYPAHLEDAKTYGDAVIVFRPVRSGDARRLQEHFYSMEMTDVATRFFQPRASFYRDQIQSMFEVDYRNHLTIVAIEGDADFGRIIGVGEYVIETGRNEAEVAFSVSKEWQGKGIAKELLVRLTTAARENGIEGFRAFILPRNQAMIQLFRKLPFSIETAVDEDCLVLSCRFEAD